MKSDFFRALGVMWEFRAHDAVRDCLETAEKLLALAVAQEGLTTKQGGSKKEQSYNK